MTGRSWERGVRGGAKFGGKGGGFLASGWEGLGEGFLARCHCCSLTARVYMKCLYGNTWFYQ